MDIVLRTRMGLWHKETNVPSSKIWVFCSSSAWSKSGSISGSTFPWAREKGMVDLGMGEHGCRKSFATGVSCKLDSLRAGSPRSVPGLHSHLLESSEVWRSFNSHSHSHWPATRKGLRSVHTALSHSYHHRSPKPTCNNLFSCLISQ